MILHLRAGTARTFIDFNAWLRQAIEDLIEHGG